MMAMEGPVVVCLLVTISGQMLVSVLAGWRPPAMYVLGDSLLDVGNNNYLPGPDVPRANMPYYGVDFPGFPTGRSSNGYNTADYVAKSMGFVSSPPPYLSLLALPAGPSSSLLVLTALTTGVSYASGDAGILDSTNAGKCIPLSTQVHYFSATKAKMVAAAGTYMVNKLLSRSIFLIGVGSNDMFVFAANEEQSRNRPAAGQRSDAATAFYADLLSGYSAAIQALYSMGARNFAIINVGQVGCVPAVRVLDAAGACAGGLNQLAAGFDAALRPLLAGLAARLPGLVYSIADFFGLSRDIFADPEAFGFTDIACACCGSGRLLAEGSCLPNATVCTDHDRHLFWDSYHPAQRACFLTAQAFYDGPAQYTTPINFMQLTHS